MRRLSKPIEELKDRYDVVVVGSGYGGAIAASRLARTGRTVCVLERGRELLPGEYPETLTEAAAEMQVDTPKGHVGRRSALYEMVVSPEISVFKGCGLGGTSLINANVALEAERRVFEDPRWPEEIRADLDTRVADGYNRARAMLGTNPYPEHLDEPAKTAAQREAAATMGRSFYRAPINVSFEDKASPAGVEQKACRLCGDCVTGCNHWSKNTLLMNYLPDARSFGAEVFTEIEVGRLAQDGDDGDGWLVHYEPLALGRKVFGAPSMVVRAGIVVLGAGALGSTGILMRSKAAGLSLSERLGEGFSGNGDVLGFAYNGDKEVSGVGFGSLDPEKLEPVGPCITSVIDARECDDLEEGMVLQEGSIPGALASILPASFHSLSGTIGKNQKSSVVDASRRLGRELISTLQGPRSGAMKRTQTFLVMSHDDGGGRLELEGDRVGVEWPGVGSQPNIKAADRIMSEAANALGATYIQNPTWSRWLDDSLVTVHPLGGCCMADRAENGVVNHKGQVFSGSSGDQVYPNLYVDDGAVPAQADWCQSAAHDLGTRRALLRADRR